PGGEAAGPACPTCRGGAGVSTVIRTELQLGSFTSEHQLDRDPWPVVAGSTGADVVQPEGPASVDLPLWTAKLKRAQLTRDVAGLTPGATIYVTLSAAFQPAWAMFTPYRLPYVELGRPTDPAGVLHRDVPTINP